MLSIQPLKSAKSACDYYTKAFDYYQGDATATAWFGNAKKLLNLQEMIDKNAMLNLLSGILPTGEKLDNNHGQHRPGFDMTFSAPKSVSVLVGLDIAPELVSFHDEAVHFALTQIEREFAEVRVRNNGEIHYVKTDNLLFATFRQPSSRANDPALHTHCVTMNLSFHEGRARSLSSDKQRQHGVVEQIQNNAHYCGLLYRHHLSNRLKEAGYSLRITAPGLFEITGVPEKVIQAFSTRREDIKALMEERGWSGAEAASKATLLTRPSKEESDLSLLKQNWQARALDLNFNQHTFVKSDDSPTINWFEHLKEKCASLFHQKNHEDPVTSCLYVAIETLSQRTSVFSERDLKSEMMKHSLMMPEIISEESIMRAIHEAKQSQTLYVSEIDPHRLTTPWLLTLEAESLARIDYHKGMVKAIATQQEVHQFQEERQHQREYPLTNSQQEAMTVLLTSEDRYLAVQGYAGSAKTTMLSEARKLIEEKGYQLRGVTVASTAAHELQKKAGIRTDVFPIVHQELKDAKRGELSKTILVVDEASMLSSPQGHALIKLVEKTHARLIFVGDSAQLPTVNNGRLFGLSQEYGIKTTVMDDIVRQKNGKARAAVIHATRQEVGLAMDKLAHVEELASYDERVAWIANHWLSQSKERRQATLLFAPTHQHRADITAVIREGLIQQGELQKEVYTQTVLKSKNLEPIQQRFASYYQTGDVVRLNHALPRIEAEYYAIGQLSQKHLKDNVLSLMNERGKIRLYPLKKLPRYKSHTSSFERLIEVYRPVQLELRVGEKIIWNRNCKAKDIRNGQSATLTAIDDKTLTFTQEDGSVKTIEKKSSVLQHLDYGYVLTNYKVQGKDAHYGIGLMESHHRHSATLKNFYVQISRVVHGMTLVTDDKVQLVRAIERNKDEKDAALDIINSRQLTAHQERFQTNIQTVIERKKEYEKTELERE